MCIRDRYIPATVIWFLVSVPVLSEQMTVAEPRVSTAGIVRIMAFLEAIALMPIASEMVITAGRPSGIAATDRLTAAKKISTGGISLRMPIINVNIDISRITTDRVTPRRAIFLTSGVDISPLCLINSEILPISVSVSYT